MPKLGDAGAQQGFVVSALVLGHQAFALGDQLGNRAFRIQNAFALHFGGVGGEHWRYIGLVQALGDVVGAHTGARQPLKAVCERAFLQMPEAIVVFAPSDVVAVFGQIGEVRKVAERADDAHGLVVAQVFQQAVERPTGLSIPAQAVGHGKLPHVFHQLVGRLAFVQVNHFAEDAPQQADVFHQRPVFVVGLRFGARAGSLGAHRRLSLLCNSVTC